MSAQFLDSTTCLPVFYSKPQLYYSYGLLVSGGQLT